MAVTETVAVLLEEKVGDEEYEPVLERVAEKLDVADVLGVNDFDDMNDPVTENVLEREAVTVQVGVRDLVPVTDDVNDLDADRDGVRDRDAVTVGVRDGGISYSQMYGLSSPLSASLAPELVASL